MTTLIRYRCKCGQQGRGYSNGNDAVAASERHLESISWGQSHLHSVRIQTRKGDGTWVATA